MTIATARNDDVEIAYETFGSPPGDPLLLVMGACAQMLYWHDEFCAALAERRFWVARFDNGDAGLSTHLSSAGVPSRLKMLRRPAETAVYRLEDMADAAVAVLDALGWEALQVVGRCVVAVGSGDGTCRTCHQRSPRLSALRLPSLSSGLHPSFQQRLLGLPLSA